VSYLWVASAESPGAERGFGTRRKSARWRTTRIRSTIRQPDANIVAATWSLHTTGKDPRFRSGETRTDYI
jgi:hypothetical protein